MLVNKSINGGRQTVSDESIDKNDTLGNLIKGTMIAAGGIALYKTGALSSLIKPLLEYGDEFANNSGKEFYSMMDALKAWTKLGDESIPKHYGSVPTLESSMFRGKKNGKLLYDAFKQDLNSGNNLYQNTRKIINDTASDINILQHMIDTNRKNSTDISKKYHNTEIMGDVREMISGFKVLQENETTFQNDYKKTAIDEFLKKHNVTEADSKAELLQTGYRKLKLADVVEMKNGELVEKTNAGIHLWDSGENMNWTGSTLENLKGFFERNNIGWEQAQNLGLDSAIRIDEAGKIIDYRMSKTAMNKFKQSLVTDFKLPFVNFNPIQVLRPNWARAGERSAFMGILGPDQIDPGITRVAGRQTIGEVLGKTFGEDYSNTSVMVVGGKGYIKNVEKGGMLKIADDLKLFRITNADQTGINSFLNAQRQVAQLSMGAVKELTKEEIEALPLAERLAYKAGKYFDMGYQEAHVKSALFNEESMSFDSATNIDEWINKAINKVTANKPFRTNRFGLTNEEYLSNADKINLHNYKDVFGRGFENIYNHDTNDIFKPQMYSTIKQGVTPEDLWKTLKTNDPEVFEQKLKTFGKQFFAGSTKDGYMDEAFNTYSVGLYRVLSGISDSIGQIFPTMGLSLASKRSVAEIGKNMVLKRALPIYLALQVPGMINAISEPFLNNGSEENGNKDNIGKLITRSVVKPTDMGFHIVKDKLGLTNVAKKIEKWVPGSDNLFELPGVYQLGLNQSKEEREDYIENGMDPIRKGRWWSSGNTPFTGGKIIQFRPNAYRRIEADVNFSDSKFGSRMEYYNNTWYPNLLNPLAPLNHFVLNRNHFDKKHYYDRPYLQTSPEGGQIPIIGPAFSSTIGRVINPVQKMHKEYWDNGLRPLQGQGESSMFLRFGTNDPRKISKYDLQALSQEHMKYFEGVKEKRQRDIAVMQNQWTADRELLSSIMERGYKSFSGTNYLELYTTPSGATSIVDVPDDQNLGKIQKNLSRMSLSKIMGARSRISPEEISTGQIPVNGDERPISKDLSYGLGEQASWLSDVFGLRGFIAREFVAGGFNQDKRKIESSSYAYSANNAFWNQNLGGLGGELSEITRRFMIKRNNSTDYVNPIRNTMPTWMPGENYFTDFLTGDPYSKVPNGEERLPGEGYERLWNMHGLMDMPIGSSFIGKGRESIVKHLLNQDTIDSIDALDITKEGTAIHNQLEKQWMESGVAIDVEGKINDTENKITGRYDAMVVDETSKTGVGIVDVKTVSAKKLKEIKKAKQALEEHQRQVNYYLWATKNTESKGYVHYVDRDNINNNYTVGFDYSDKMLKETLTDLKNARNDIKAGLKSGSISRADLYRDIDRYRVLADVAPYSDEFKNMKAKLSWQTLSQKDQEEYTAINERLKKQKEPLRVYPYKFKTSNLQSESVKVKRIIDNNTILVDRYGTEHAVKLAGIHVSQDDTNRYKDTTSTMNDAANKEIKRYLRPGSMIRIGYDADDRNKFTKDSTESIRAVIHSKGVNVNKALVKKELAKENEDDNTPAGINARYSKGEIYFGSMMERLTHSVFANIPFAGNKFFQVRSPYEMYRKKEVYSKDFQSWNHPVRDILRPAIDEWIGTSNPIAGVMAAGFIGSMFGRKKYGKILGASAAMAVTAIGKGWAMMDHEKGRAWRPDRRVKQEEMNEYIDVLKYIKNQKLYEQYKQKAKQEDNFDVDKFLESKESSGVYNKLKKQELIDFKKTIKVDFKHRNQYTFKYGEPKYYNQKSSLVDTLKNIDQEIKELSTTTSEDRIKKRKKKAIHDVNLEIKEIEGSRRIERIPTNALMALSYKKAADSTMYGYEPGDSLVNIMSALPKKERQYFKYFMKAPEEEKQKILRIAPSYLRRALQSTWGMKVDEKPTLDQYFKTHGLPDATWSGWDESTDIEDVKVKLVHHNKLDPGEFDIWNDQERKAEQVSIPVPVINGTNTGRIAELRLKQILGEMGYQDVMVSSNKADPRFRTNTSTINIKRDARGKAQRELNDIDDL